MRLPNVLIPTRHPLLHQRAVRPRERLRTGQRASVPRAGCLGLRNALGARRPELTAGVVEHLDQPRLQLSQRLTSSRPLGKGLRRLSCQPVANCGQQFSGGLCVRGQLGVQFLGGRNLIPQVLGSSLRGPAGEGTQPPHQPGYPPRPHAFDPADAERCGHQFGGPSNRVRELGRGQCQRRLHVLTETGFDLVEQRVQLFVCHAATFICASSRGTLSKS